MSIITKVEIIKKNNIMGKGILTDRLPLSGVEHMAQFLTVSKQTFDLF